VAEKPRDGNDDGTTTITTMIRCYCEFLTITMTVLSLKIPHWRFLNSNHQLDISRLCGDLSPQY